MQLNKITMLITDEFVYLPTYAYLSSVGNAYTSLF